MMQGDQPVNGFVPVIGNKRHMVAALRQEGQLGARTGIGDEASMQNGGIDPNEAEGDQQCGEEARHVRASRADMCLLPHVMPA